MVKSYPARFKTDKNNILLAQKALDRLWFERCKERGADFNQRAHSCKFASLLARSLFGGKLDGNWDHVFVRLDDGEVLDLNAHQQDVIDLGDRAHLSDPKTLLHQDYRESLGSCLPRVKRWVEWFENEIHVINKEKKKSKRLSDEGFSP